MYIRLAHVSLASNKKRKTDLHATNLSSFRFSQYTKLAYMVCKHEFYAIIPDVFYSKYMNHLYVSMPYAAFHPQVA